MLTVAAVLSSGGSPTLAGLRSSHLIQLGVDLALAVAGMLLLHLVTEITTRQEARHAGRTATPVSG